MLFVCEQYGQWRAVTGWCYPVERVVLGGDTGQNDGDVPVPPEQHELRARVGERDGLLSVSRGEGRVQHGVGGEGYSGELTRQCSFFGDWIKVCGLCTGSRCPAEEQSAVMWAATDSMETASWVSGLGAGFARVCGEVTGECSCPATTMDEVEYPASAAGTVFHLECPAGYTGSFERRCNGKIEKNCVRITCREESFEGVMWPATKGGLTAVHSCGEDEEGGLRRVCRENGLGSSVVSGEGCYCQPTVVKACSTMYAGTIRCTCSLGGSWTDLVSECERITCPGETMEGLFFPTTESDTTRVRREERVERDDGGRVLVPGGGGVPQRRQHVFDGGGGERDVRREHDGHDLAFVFAVRRVVCDPRRGQAYASAFSVRRSS